MASFDLAVRLGTSWWVPAVFKVEMVKATSSLHVSILHPFDDISESKGQLLLKGNDGLRHVVSCGRFRLPIQSN